VTVPGGAVTILDGVESSVAAERVERERARLDAEIARARARLADEGFVAKAPPQIVAAEREKLAELERQRESL
jgi:valyl-tRNA synthetase